MPAPATPLGSAPPLPSFRNLEVCGLLSTSNGSPWTAKVSSLAGKANIFRRILYRRIWRKKYPPHSSCYSSTHRRIHTAEWSIRAPVDVMERTHFVLGSHAFGRDDTKNTCVLFGRGLTNFVSLSEAAICTETRKTPSIDSNEAESTKKNDKLLLHFSNSPFGQF